MREHHDSKHTGFGGIGRGLLLCLLLVMAFNPLRAAPVVEKLHFLIPGGAGGGWDITARDSGAALVESGLLGKASYQNLSGAGGGRAIDHLIGTAARHENTLLVHSTPILIRSLTRIYPHSFRDLTPVAAIISDYNVFVVRADSRLRQWSDVVDAYRKKPRRFKFGGGSPNAGLDHVIAHAALRNGGVEIETMRYIAYDGGGKAMSGLLAGEFDVLSTGLGEALEMSKSDQVRILAVTAPQRLEEAPLVPTLAELGNNTVYANWRGFFAPPGTADSRVAAYVKMFERMYDTPQWESTRARHGWINSFKPAREFWNFLEQQERRASQVLQELGPLKASKRQDW